MLRSLLRNFSKTLRRWAASMDYSKAYDCMSSVVTEQLLLKGGWPVGLCRVLAQVWGTQFRYVDNDPMKVPFSFVPQGCPFGPVAMAAWMCSGQNRVSATVSPSLSRFYMDGRSFTASSPSLLCSLVSEWEKFSASVGLREPPTKLQLFARNSRRLSEFPSTRIVFLLSFVSWVAASIFLVRGCRLNSLIVSPKLNALLP